MMKFRNDPDQKPGKKNRLKVGQRVMANPTWLNWHSSHLSWSYGVTVEDDNAYDEGQKEIREEDLPEVFFLIHCKLSGKMPKGIISGYGADDDIVKGRKNVRVEFGIKTDIGTINYTSILTEDDLEKVKKRTKK